MRTRLSDYQEKYGDLFNLEATPAESTAFRLAKHDKEQFPDIITANQNGDPYYTNSSHLPVGYTEDVFAALDIQDDLQTLYTSGTVFHAFLGEKLPDWQAAAKLVRTIAENYKLPYYTLSPTYSVCKTHGYLNGEQFVCPHCGEPTEVYSRITGYYRPVQNWNIGKTQEYRDRREYVLADSRLTHRGPLPEGVATARIAEKEDAAKAPAASDITKATLFARVNCPNCKIARAYMDKAGFEYDEVIAEEEPELTTAYGVKQAPTLIVPDAKGGFSKYSGAGAIRAMLG